MQKHPTAGRLPVRRWFARLGLLVSSAVLPFGCAFTLESAQAAGEMWRPTPGTSWQWQLSTRVVTPLDVDAYEVDGFDTSGP